MDAVKIYEDAVRKLDRSEITLGEFEQIIAPLRNVIQPKRGKWVWNGDTLDWERLHYCSECKKYALRDTDGKEVLSDFCPHCGAMMERGEAE